MFDELERLRGDEYLQRLLAHYAETGADRPEVWQDRVMQMEGVEPKELTRLHGELIAFGWVDQNTGQTCPVKPGLTAGCYRVTRDGLRALKPIGINATTAFTADPRPGEGEDAARLKKPRANKRRPNKQGEAAATESANPDGMKTHIPA
jgi:hypothetical protein